MEREGPLLKTQILFGLGVTAMITIGLGGLCGVVFLLEKEPTPKLTQESHLALNTHNQCVKTVSRKKLEGWIRDNPLVKITSLAYDQGTGGGVLVLYTIPVPKP